MRARFMRRCVRVRRACVRCAGEKRQVGKRAKSVRVRSAGVVVVVRWRKVVWRLAAATFFTFIYAAKKKERAAR